MRILSRYIGRTILFTTLLATFLIVSIYLLFALVEELRVMGEGDYTLIKVFQYVLLTLPSRLYFIFPMACLIGALMGLGLLAGHSELIVMRSSGVSVLQICLAVLRAALLLVILITLFGEFVVPHTTRYAEMLREEALTKNQTVTTPQGTWIRDGQNFIRIKQIMPNGELLGVIRYEFDANQQLQSATFAQRAKYSSQKKQWQMFDVRQTTLNEDNVDVSSQPQQIWQANIQPSLVNILVEQPDSLSIVGLINYIQYLRDNQLRTQEYALALWKKVWQPMATMVMIFIAIPVVLGPLRSATMGLRLLTGVLIGFAFYITNQLFGPLSLVYSPFSPIFAASLPSIIFAGAGLFMLRGVK